MNAGGIADAYRRLDHALQVLEACRGLAETAADNRRMTAADLAARLLALLDTHTTGQPAPGEPM